MLNLIKAIKLIRYLIVWRVNRSLVRVPADFAADISMMLGTIIANRLSTKEAKLWKKIGTACEDFKKRKKQKRPIPIPDISWPLNSVIFVYPAKSTYGLGEYIFWELKLMGDDADHGLFLELVLPAMEEASYMNNMELKYSNEIWGKFDIHSIYVARGPSWEPIVHNGRLDLRYDVDIRQWSEDVEFTSPKKLRTVEWVTPFDFRGLEAQPDSENTTAKATEVGPSLSTIFEATIQRLNGIAVSKKRHHESIADILTADDYGRLEELREDLKKIETRNESIQSVPQYRAGQGIGFQTFKAIPVLTVPYLELASILHVGNFTHFGCGTFRLQ